MTTTTRGAPPVTAQSRFVWIRGPVIDAVVAFAWVPVFVLGRSFADTPDRLAELTTAVLLVSFCHQPVTLPLVYGDVRERARHGVLLIAAPVLAVLAVYAGLGISLVLVGVVAAAWNAHHTLRQRYGLVRVYGRKVGQDDGEHEQALLLWWFGLVLLVSLAGHGLLERLASLPVGFLNHQIVDLLGVVQPVAALLALPVAVGAVVTTIRWWRLERARPQNRAKHLYLLGAAVAFAVAPFDPVAGFLAFMSAHSIEYVVVVAGTVRRRAVPRSMLDRIVRRPGGPVLFLAGYIAVVLIVVALLRRVLPLQVFLATYLAVGVLHFVYDGMIWRLRRPEVAGTFAIAGDA